jgi:hypothetical protein
MCAAVREVAASHIEHAEQGLQLRGLIAEVCKSCDPEKGNFN